MTAISEGKGALPHIVIIGCGSAGVSAAIYARKTLRTAKISLITTESIPEYSRCGLPYGISGEIPNLEDLIVHPVSWYTRLLKADLHLRTSCTNIDLDSQQVTLKSLDDGQDKVVGYDKLILATGSKPSRPPIAGLDKENIFNCWTFKDAQRIKKASQAIKDVVIIGAGLIGMEVAEALHKMGKHVHIVEFLPDILLAMVDPDVASIIRTKIVPEDIEVYVNWAAKKINGNTMPTGVVIQDRKTGEEKEIPAEMVVLATGVRPNTELGQDAGIPVGPTGGYVTNERQETPIKNVYAAGDCAEYTSAYWGRPILTALGTVAVRQGRVAGINAAGGHATSPNILMNRVTKLFGYEIAAVGMTSQYAQRNSIELVAVRGKASSLPEYYPGGKDIILKLLFRPTEKTLHGAQIIGETQSAQRMNALALAITRLTAEDLSTLETCYAPPIAPTWDVINVVGEAAARRFQRGR
ncbi:MAG: NAD(P)/FAD-dependent oxidoreductase [Candidatus Ranarchaeia archaeon]